jgi:hypothetical protein
MHFQLVQHFSYEKKNTRNCTPPFDKLRQKTLEQYNTYYYIQEIPLHTEIGCLQGQGVYPLHHQLGSGATPPLWNSVTPFRLV